ncbi:MAG: hypothetical protein FWE22_07835 [Firmicutes bacterium]|nr:hypothetical protein [Bacillota bacterium]
MVINLPNISSNVFADAFWHSAGAGQFAWGVIFMLIVGTMLIVANVLRRKVRIFRRALMPTAVIAGLMILVVKEVVLATTNLGSIYVGGRGFEMVYVPGDYINQDYPGYGRLPGVYERGYFYWTFGDLLNRVLSSVIYHALPIAFIALGLRDKKDYSEDMTKERKKRNRAGAFKSGSVLVSTYMVQALVGLGVTIALFAIIPDLLPGAGLFLPLGFGQGPPQAFAMGGVWNTATDGSFDWRNFALTIAAFGFLFSSIPGVIMINRIAKRKGITRVNNEYQKVGDMPMQQFETPDEVPLSESIDKFTLQVCMVLGTYLITIGLIFAIDVIFRATGVQFLIGLIPTFWGFAFMIAMLVAFVVKAILRKLRKKKIMNRKYPNTYMMNRIAGLSFDISIVCALTLISVRALGLMWIPAIAMAALGGLATGLWLRFVTRRVYPDYKDEAFLAMYGLLTGTLACGTILSREIDPNLKTPAAEDMVIGSAGAVVLAFPLIILVPIAATGLNFIWIFGVLAVYLGLLTCFILNVHKKLFKRKAVAVDGDVEDAVSDITQVGDAALGVPQNIEIVNSEEVSETNETDE